MDNQHKAVIEAARELKAERYWSRSDDEQYDYLGAVGDLVREVAFILNQAGIEWPDLAAAIKHGEGSAAVAQSFALSGGPSIEYALGVAVDRRRRELVEGADA